MLSLANGSRTEKGKVIQQGYKILSCSENKISVLITVSRRAI